MKFLKRLVLFLAIFVSTFASIECSVVEKNQIIIGTWQVERNEAYDYVSRALNKGFIKIDTAQDYKNEEEVGRAISDYEKKTGKRVYVITKFNLDSADNDYKNTIKLFFGICKNFCRRILYRKIY